MPTARPAGEGWNAMDGDQDIAMALLMADKQWGSDRQVELHAGGKNTIAALKAWNMKRRRHHQGPAQREQQAARPTT